jgi:predicted hotdog family 3-hydroxylacyl-ACP dehydratase
MTRLDRRQIEDLIPHAGAMCLLDEVFRWDDTSLQGLSRSAAAPANPLRRGDGRLGATSAIEIAAQAMALHGRLCAGSGGPIPGMLVSLRDVRLHRPVLDSAGPLAILVRRLSGDARGASYDFTVAADDATLLEGRAMVLFG